MNLQKTQERTDRALSRKRKHEDDEFETQLIEQELVEQGYIINDEAQKINVISRLKLRFTI